MTPEEEATAQKRFLTIGIIRIAGAIMLVLGLAVIAKGTFGWPKAVGYLLFVNGIVDFLVLPVILAKKWKSSSNS
jgi:hypothetical protein